MDYSEFLNYIEESVKKITEDTAYISIHNVIKNNALELDGLVILERDQNVSPTIYLNDYYTEYLDGRELDSIIEEIYNLYQENRGKFDFPLDYFKDFNRIKSRIAYKLINYERNQKLLSMVPHRKILDLAIVYYCVIDSEQLGCATALIYNNHMKLWDTSEEELFRLADENTPNLFRPVLRNMEEILQEMLLNEKMAEEDTNEILDDMQSRNTEVPMYVLTNESKLNGAVCLFYTNVLKEFCNNMNRDIYILPSSIHEVILIPSIRHNEVNRLESMVREVNETQVENEEILSDNVYIYDRSTDCLMMARDIKRAMVTQ